jgi:hypothetical protein
VVEVKMGEQDVQPRRVCGERDAQVPDPRARIEHDDGAVVERDLNTGRVSSVANRFRPG